ncbi:DegT/DnrJ/EryC1/StrS family aminotransferase [Pseudoduganella namucuonensis]|uniref:dTDP-4-amino-4,6-dideoxygalactose transaminase n=1 Tax=Pseudoduganella namucuonensis TaxID=1035707 RepID=A0A1I7GEM2_9BURK|nr:DegT/DnrJ/EryC1/StrS family aminotransferase [Pseudoduganella namucuonensis]SFU46937.1 dTDP-4-amino-4,6-dideoxygalactose transaminase [Pseudoduganella namucuonensis]
MAAPRPSSAAIPRLPVLSLAAFRRARAGAPPALPSLLDAGAVRLVTSGRVAIALALRELGVGPGDSVLVPAYHSPSMVPPVLWRGARPVFYRVDAAAAVDLADLDARLDGTVKAVMVTHYFGFPQDMGTIRAWCDRHGVALLEDCAHSFFGRHGGLPVGSHGDYAIGSGMKFYPIFEGGCLVSARRPLDGVALRSAGRGFEAKAALAVLEHSFAHGRLGALRALLRLPLWCKDKLWAALKARRGAALPDGAVAAELALAPASSDSSYDFDPRWLDKRSAWFSRWVLRRADAGRVTALRRRHYLALEAAVRDLPGCRPLHAALPEGACPWLFPLWVARPDAVFAALRAAEVPLVRFGHTLWPGVDAAICPQAVALGHHVLALPCHQDLNAAELARLCAALRAALAAAQ